MTAPRRISVIQTGRQWTASGQVRSVGLGSVVRSDVSIGVTFAPGSSRLSDRHAKMRKGAEAPFL